jgi:hypothetical protein
LLSFTHILDIIKFFTPNFLELGTSFNNYIHFFCKRVTFICKTIVNLIIETRITNKVIWKEIADIFFYEPGGTSTKNIIHWNQEYTRQKISQYDYGKKQNIEVYGTESPPDIEISKWNEWGIPSLLTISDADPFSTEKDTNIFIEIVKNKSIIKTIRLNGYNHLDYIWSSEAEKDFYHDIVAFLVANK